MTASGSRPAYRCLPFSRFALRLRAVETRPNGWSGLECRLRNAPRAPLSPRTRARNSHLASGEMPISKWYNSRMHAIVPCDVGSYSYAGTGYANPHAVTSVGGTSYTYDNNGNVTAMDPSTTPGTGAIAWRALREAAGASRPTATTKPASACSRRPGARRPHTPEPDTTTWPRARSQRRPRSTSSRRTARSRDGEGERRQCNDDISSLFIPITSAART